MIGFIRVKDIPQFLIVSAISIALFILVLPMWMRHPGLVENKVGFFLQFGLIIASSMIAADCICRWYKVQDGARGIIAKGSIAARSGDDHSGRRGMAPARPYVDEGLALTKKLIALFKLSDWASGTPAFTELESREIDRELNSFQRMADREARKEGHAQMQFNPEAVGPVQRTVGAGALCRLAGAGWTTVSGWDLGGEYPDDWKARVSTYLKAWAMNLDPDALLELAQLLALAGYKSEGKQASSIVVDLFPRYAPRFFGGSDDPKLVEGITKRAKEIVVEISNMNKTIVHQRSESPRIDSQSARQPVVLRPDSTPEELKEFVHQSSGRELTDEELEILASRLCWRDEATRVQWHREEGMEIPSADIAPQLEPKNRLLMHGLDGEDTVLAIWRFLFSPIIQKHFGSGHSLEWTKKLIANFADGNQTAFGAQYHSLIPEVKAAMSGFPEHSMSNPPWSMFSLDMRIGIIPWVSPGFEKWFATLLRNGSALEKHFGEVLPFAFFLRGGPGDSRESAFRVCAPTNTVRVSAEHWLMRAYLDGREQEAHFTKGPDEHNRSFSVHHYVDQHGAKKSVFFETTDSFGREEEDFGDFLQGHV